MALIFKIFALAYIALSLLIPKTFGYFIENEMPELVRGTWENTRIHYAVATTSSTAPTELRDFIKSEVLRNMILPEDVTRDFEREAIVFLVADIMDVGFLAAAKCNWLHVLIKTGRKCVVVFDRKLIQNKGPFLRSVAAHEIAHHVGFRLDRIKWKQFAALLPAGANPNEHFAEIYRQFYCKTCRDVPAWEELIITPALIDWFVGLFGEYK